MDRWSPKLATVIRQGIEEGAFATDRPDDVAEIILIIGMALSRTVERSLLAQEGEEDTLGHIGRKAAVYEGAAERLLKRTARSSPS